MMDDTARAVSTNYPRTVRAHFWEGFVRDEAYNCIAADRENFGFAFASNKQGCSNADKGFVGCIGVLTDGLECGLNYFGTVSSCAVGGAVGTDGNPSAGEASVSCRSKLFYRYSTSEIANCCCQVEKSALKHD